MKRRALFLDRDGVINVDHGYVYQQDRFEFMPGIFDLCRVAKARGYLLFVITNQAGIGRGLYTEAEFHTLTGWMRAVFEHEECAIDEVYFCPTHPEHGLGEYRKESWWRKPNPGMILDAQRAFDVDLEGSVLVGDKTSDIDAGRTAGIGQNVLFLPNGNVAELPGALTIRAFTDLYPLLTAEDKKSGAEAPL